jgi:hypothetical protein
MQYAFARLLMHSNESDGSSLLSSSEPTGHPRHDAMPVHARHSAPSLPVAVARVFPSPDHSLSTRRGAPLSQLMWNVLRCTGPISCRWSSQHPTPIMIFPLPSCTNWIINWCQEARMAWRMEYFNFSESYKHGKKKSTKGGDGATFSHSPIKKPTKVVVAIFVKISFSI